MEDANAALAVSDVEDVEEDEAAMSDDSDAEEPSVHGPGEHPRSCLSALDRLQYLSRRTRILAGGGKSLVALGPCLTAYLLSCRGRVCRAPTLAVGILCACWQCHAAAVWVLEVMMSEAVCLAGCAGGASAAVHAQTNGAANGSS